MADQDETHKVKAKNTNKNAEKVHPASVFAEDMSEEWSKDAIKAARDAFALTIASGRFIIYLMYAFHVIINNK